MAVILAATAALSAVDARPATATSNVDLQPIFVAPASISVNVPYRWTVRVINNGPGAFDGSSADAFSVAVGSDQQDAASLRPLGGDCLSFARYAVTCHLPAIPAYGSAYLTFEVTVSGRSTNAMLSALFNDVDNIDVNQSNDRYTRNVAVDNGLPDQMAVELDKPAYQAVLPGANRTLTGRVRYTGAPVSGQIRGATLIVEASAGGQIINVIPAGGTACAGPPEMIHCPLPPIAGSGMLPLQYTVQTRHLSAARFDVTARIVPPISDNGLNNVASRRFTAVDPNRWRDLMSARPSAAVQANLASRPNPSQCLDWHKIEDAVSEEVAWDYYPVQVDRLPNRPGTTTRFTAQQLLEYVRLHLTHGTEATGWAGSLVAPNLTRFTPYSRAYPQSYATDPNRDEAFMTASPLASVLEVYIPSAYERAAIAVTARRSGGSLPNYWMFTTVRGSCEWTVLDHPVSGNREFRVDQRSDGAYVFATRGVDRITNALFDANKESVKAGQAATWSSFQANLADFVNRNGGSARVLSPEVYDIPWNEACHNHWMPTEAWTDEGLPARDPAKCG